MQAPSTIRSHLHIPAGPLILAIGAVVAAFAVGAALFAWQGSDSDGDTQVSVSSSNPLHDAALQEAYNRKMALFDGVEYVPPTAPGVSSAEAAYEKAMQDAFTRKMERWDQE